MTKEQLIQQIESRGVTPTPKALKADLEAQLAALPGHRIRSSVDSPVNAAWEFADRVFAEARENGEDPPRRKDVVAAMQDSGIAYYTARTQFQSWFTHTARGTNLLTDGNARN